jgi:hypothetical protein
MAHLEPRHVSIITRRRRGATTNRDAIPRRPIDIRKPRQLAVAIQIPEFRVFLP